MGIFKKSSKEVKTEEKVEEIKTVEPTEEVKANTKTDLSLGLEADGKGDVTDEG